MKRVLHLLCVVLVGVFLTACSGGGGSDGDSTATTEATGFTAEMLDAGPTYYVTYPGDVEGTTTVGTTQEKLAVSGSSGTYQVEVTSSYFDAAGGLVYSETLAVSVTLNEDGTLSATVEGDPSISTLTLAESTTSYLYVTGVEGADSWDEYWYLSKPAGWLTDSSDTPGFTTQMLDGDPTFYVSFNGDPEGITETGTTQTTIAFSGSGGTYLVTFTESYYDDGGALVSSNSDDVNATLNQDGTLRITLDDGSYAETITLNSSTETYLYVTEDTGSDSWSDYWYVSQPAGWLTDSSDTPGFTTELLDTNPTLYFAETVDEGIDQTIITITGSNGTYTLDVSEYEFYDQGNLTASWTGQFSAQLQGDGSLLVTTPEGSLVLDLLEVSPTEYWVVTGKDEFGIWEEYWYYSKPPNWIEI